MRRVDDLPDRELIIAQAKRNKEIVCGVGAFVRHGHTYYHFYRDGVLVIISPY